MDFGRLNEAVKFGADENKHSALTGKEGTPYDYTIAPSQGDGWKITTPWGYIDYRHRPEESTNEIWWVESHKHKHGSELVDLMQKHHPAETVAWGATSSSGRELMNRWHKANPDIGKDDSGPFEGQFDPFDHSDSEEDYEDDDYLGE